LLDDWTTIDHARYDIIQPFLVPLVAGGARPTRFVLSVAEAGTGSGTITSTLPAISCGSVCSASFLSGASVTLSATAASGSTFTGWSGACTGTGTCMVSMTATRSVTANFSGGTGTGCSNPTTFTNQSGNFNTTGAVCLRTSQPVNGWGCSNFDGRTVRVNSGPAVSTCGGGPIAPSADGFTYFMVSAGTIAWASLFTW
jgi:hypothetical protein